MEQRHWQHCSRQNAGERFALNVGRRSPAPVPALAHRRRTCHSVVVRVEQGHCWAEDVVVEVAMKRAVPGIGATKEQIDAVPSQRRTLSTTKVDTAVGTINDEIARLPQTSGTVPDPVTQAEAENKDSTVARIWTPQRVWQAIYGGDHEPVVDQALRHQPAQRLHAPRHHQRQRARRFDRQVARDWTETSSQLQGFDQCQVHRPRRHACRLRQSGPSAKGQRHSQWACVRRRRAGQRRRRRDQLHRTQRHAFEFLHAAKAARKSWSTTAATGLAFESDDGISP